MKRVSKRGVTMMSLAVAAAGATSFSYLTAQAAAPPGPGAPPAPAAPTVPPGPAPGTNDPAKMSFFVTSTAPGGGDLGGIAGADAHCATLAREQDLARIPFAGTDGEPAEGRCTRPHR